jgi:hypothetical protein
MRETSLSLSLETHRRRIYLGDKAAVAAGLVHVRGADGYTFFGFESAL